MLFRFALLAGVFFFLRSSFAASPDAQITTVEEKDGLRLKSPYLNVEFSTTHPALLFLGVDSLGGNQIDRNVMEDDVPSASTYKVQHDVNDSGIQVDYAQGELTDPSWTFKASAQGITFISQWNKEGKPPEPLLFTFATRYCYSTVLGTFSKKGEIDMPAVLHFPGFGTMRLTVTGIEKSTIGYGSGISGPFHGWIKVKLPAATQENPRIEYHWDVTTIYPDVPWAKDDPRYDGFRRNWLNIFQLNPNRRLLANNTNSDTCGFCFYEYGDIAKATPPLADGLYALDMVRQSLEGVLSGTKTYGMPGYGDFPEETSDTFPSFLIAAYDYVDGRSDKAWLEKNYDGIKKWADKMLATDHDGNGLIEYVATGNSGSWPEGSPKVRPSNWWDTIGFGHEDAYANALAYRALQNMQQMALLLDKAEDAAVYEAAAKKLHDSYFSTFYNPKTGILAGWHSKDGELHDYYFLFVNGIAILYGLVPDDKAGPIMDTLWEKMKGVGYTNFSLGLPGNLVSVARKDYAHKEPRYGGGHLEDNADGFQIYENGGATACYAYFTLAAFDRIGQHDRADQILFPILKAFDKREFEGGNNDLKNWKTNDWRKWDGSPQGYEGFLTDNYYALLAVPERKLEAPAPAEKK